MRAGSFRTGAPGERGEALPCVLGWLEGGSGSQSGAAGAGLRYRKRAAGSAGRLLSGAGLGLLQSGLTKLAGLAFRLGDGESTTSVILGGIEFLVYHGSS